MQLSVYVFHFPVLRDTVRWIYTQQILFFEYFLTITHVFYLFLVGADEDYLEVRETRLSIVSSQPC